MTPVVKARLSARIIHLINELNWVCLRLCEALVNLASWFQIIQVLGSLSCVSKVVPR
jgi:hypothetical protein